MDFKNSQARQSRAFTPVADEEIWQNLFSFWECSTYLSKDDPYVSAKSLNRNSKIQYTLDRLF